MPRGGKELEAGVRAPGQRPVVRAGTGAHPTGRSEQREKSGGKSQVHISSKGILVRKQETKQSVPADIKKLCIILIPCNIIRKHMQVPVSGFSSGRLEKSSTKKHTATLPDRC